MSESSVAVANYFIQKGLEEGRPITPMQALKLVYIAHGWHLGYSGSPLISDAVEAWKFGPVIPVLYHEIKVFGANPIDSLISLWDGRGGKVSHPMIHDPKLAKFLDSVWMAYREMNGLQLSTLTHQMGTPWDDVWNRQGGRGRVGAEIPDSLIAEHYKQRIEAARAQAAS